jgi:subtilisin family serine protease
MKKLTLLPLFVVLVLINLSSATFVNAQKDPERSEKFKRVKNAIPNRYIVVFDENVVRVNDVLPTPLKSEAISRVSSDLASSYGGRIHSLYAFALKGYAAEMSRQDALRLSLDPRVRFVEEDSIVYADQTTQTGAPWGLDRIDQRNLPLPGNFTLGNLNGAPSTNTLIYNNGSYTYTTTGANVNAYILDSGIRASHQEFAGRIKSIQDFINDGKNGEDCNGHGTHVAGIVGGSTYGVAKNVNIHSIRVLGCSGSSANSSTLNGINWVIQNHVKPAVINMSLGGGFSNASNTAVQNAINAGITVVVSAGNENNDACDKSPASAPEVLTVGSTGHNSTDKSQFDNRSSFSNYGNCVDIFAPGSFITSADYQGDNLIINKSGTSMAAPHVAGVAARFLQNFPNATPAQVANSLVNDATNGVVVNAGPGSPNKLLFADSVFNGTPPPAPAPTPAPAIRINESGPATPYPSTLTVSGLSGVIGNEPNSLQVRINGFSHTYPGEVSFLLEGPTGARLLIQSFVAEGEDANNHVYTISDAGAEKMSTSALVQGSVYKPTALSLSNGFSLPNFPSPGPGNSYNNPGPANNGTATLISTFGGTNPNGTWSLYVKDEFSGDRGRIDNWSLDILTS